MLKGVIAVSVCVVGLFAQMMPIGSSGPKAGPPSPKPGPPAPKPSPPPKSFNFIFFGDWGTGHPEQKKIADQISATSLEIHAQFIVALGDNFYGPNVNQAGPANDTDPQWNNRYRDVYTGAGTFIPWYAILGNHDYYLPGNSYAQIEFYKNHRDNRWNMPDHNYTKCWEFQGQTLQIVFIDTVRLNPAIANVNILTPPKPLALQMAQSEQHLAWIEATLAASTADWLIVAGHYNIYTLNFDPDPSLLPLVTLMEQYGVDAYMNGHVHNFQHDVVNGISYITVGKASDKDSPLTAAKSGTAADVLFAQDTSGFGVMTLEGGCLSFRYINDTGGDIYNYKFPQYPRTSKPTRMPTKSPASPKGPPAPKVPPMPPTATDALLSQDSPEVEALSAADAMGAPGPTKAKPMPPVKPPANYLRSA